MYTHACSYTVDVRAHILNKHILKYIDIHYKQSCTHTVYTVYAFTYIMHNLVHTHMHVCTHTHTRRLTQGLVIVLLHTHTHMFSFPDLSLQDHSFVAMHSFLY